MISSLRRALQPAVTDLSIKFDVPPSFKVYQAPEKVPTLFSGDKLVVYCIMKQRKSASDQSVKSRVNGTATLTGHILSKPIQFKLTFEISDFQSSIEMPIVHQLTSKALIHELQSRDDWIAATMYEQQKKAIVNLSIESGVVSSYTAYIALDEEQEKLIEGAVKTWDVVATMAQYRKSVPPHIPPMNHHFGQAEGPTLGQVRFGRADGPTPDRVRFGRAESPTLGRVGFGRVEDITTFSRNKIAGLRTRPKAKIVEGPVVFHATPMSVTRKRELRKAKLESSCSEDHLEQDVEPRYSRLSAQPRPSSRDNKVEGPRTAIPVSLAREREQNTVNPQVAGPRDNLEFLIFLQSIEGFWDIDTLQWLDFPILLKMDNVKICATVYALAYMEIKFPSRRDEWELVARKAEAWLERQTLPDQVNLEELNKEASDYIITNLVE